MIPNLEVKPIEVIDEPSLTYGIDWERKAIIGVIDGLEAIEQSIFLLLNTERFMHLIFSFDYGMEAGGLMGMPVSYVYPELERRITEAILQDDRVEEVNNFAFTKNKNKVTVTFNVVTAIGEIEVTKEVIV